MAFNYETANDVRILLEYKLQQLQQLMQGAYTVIYSS